MSYKLSKRNSGGTCLQGEFDCSYSELVAAIGKPNSSGDGYKVSTEWVLADDETGRVFTIYDWKETSMYDRSLPSSVSLRAAPTVNWHIGGASDPSHFKAWLRAQIAGKPAKAKRIRKPANPPASEVLQRIVSDLHSRDSVYGQSKIYAIAALISAVRVGLLTREQAEHISAEYALGFDWSL